jgi:simple sugar transport system ATP-binding protein
MTSQSRPSPASVTVTPAPAIELFGIRKSFDGFTVLDNADFAALRGEVHALLGENGAGKSSLMNIAAGLYLPEAGSVRVDGAERRFSGPSEAAASGIGMVHQHYKLVYPLTVAENVLLAVPRGRFRSGLKQIEREIAERAESLGMPIDPHRIVGTLSVAEQQRVEILKALIGGAATLILDEPTAVLTDNEAERLMITMRRFAASGAAVVLVTHKLHEVKGYADRVTVMRGGRTVATSDPKGLSIAALTELVVGAAAPPVVHSRAAPGGVLLSLTGLTCARADGTIAVPDLDLQVRKGEILGLAGVGGNGQTELMEALMGVRPPVAGQIRLGDAGDIAKLSPQQRRGLGIAVVPADRAAYALAGSLSIAENYALGAVHTGRYGGGLRLRRRRMRDEAAVAMRDFAVQGVRGLNQKAALLSGGNAQKLVLAREFARQPRLVLAHSPCRGLDVRAAADVQRRLLAARADGAAVLLISDDLEEVLALSDRVGVLNRGRLVALLDAPADRQHIGQAMVGHA